MLNSIHLYKFSSQQFGCLYYNSNQRYWGQLLLTKWLWWLLTQLVRATCESTKIRLVILVERLERWLNLKREGKMVILASQQKNVSALKCVDLSNPDTQSSVSLLKQERTHKISFFFFLSFFACCYYFSVATCLCLCPIE